MYSMVLMMAMSTSPEAAACHKSVGCSGCTGCTGVVVVDAGCCGGDKHGCCGGGLFSKHGCCGGGLFAGKGCCGGGLFSKHGCCGGGLFSHKHKGCCGGAVVCSGCSGCDGTIVVPAAPAVEPKKEMPKKEGGNAAATNAPAIVTVNVPADAKVTIDGNNTVSTSAVRHYATPALNAGTVHYYTFAAEVVRDGKVYSTTEKVAVEAGAKVVITLNPNVGPAVASK